MPRAAVSSSFARSVAGDGNCFDHDWKIADASDPGNVLQAKICGVLDRGKGQSRCRHRQEHRLTLAGAKERDPGASCGAAEGTLGA